MCLLNVQDEKKESKIESSFFWFGLLCSNVFLYSHSIYNHMPKLIRTKSSYVSTEKAFQVFLNTFWEFLTKTKKCCVKKKTINKPIFWNSWNFVVIAEDWKPSIQVQSIVGYISIFEFCKGYKINTIFFAYGFWFISLAGPQFTPTFTHFN